MTKAFEDHVRQQLDIFRHEIRFAQEREMRTEERIFRAQAAAYRMGLETVLNSAVVEKLFEGYDFGGAEE